jgi:hypothetical protein
LKRFLFPGTGFSTIPHENFHDSELIIIICFHISYQKKDHIISFFQHLILFSLLPAPRNPAPLPAPVSEHPAADAPLYPIKRKIEELNKRIPPYGKRQGWVPRTPEDFGDGGAPIFIFHLSFFFILFFRKLII